MKVLKAPTVMLAIFASLIAMTGTALTAGQLRPAHAGAPYLLFDTVDSEDVTTSSFLQHVQLVKCRPAGRRIFFENCWWRRVSCRGAIIGASRTRMQCLSCPDLPGGRCPRGI